MAAGLRILAPGLMQQSWSAVEALGAAAWLWTHSDSHRGLPLHCLSRMLMPAILRRQFVLASEREQPVLYAAWAKFDSGSEQRYLQLHPSLLAEADWCSGDRLWITDFIAPFGHARLANQLLRKRLLAAHVMRFLYHRGEAGGMRILTVPGAALTRQEFRHWQQTHPLDWPAKEGR